MVQIKRINTITNLGVYRNFRWDVTLPDFKFFNIVYGWNGTGKTTLSRSFAALDSGLLPDGYPEMSASFLLDNDENISIGERFNTPVFVFNQDFVDENVDFARHSSKTISLVLGKQSKEAISEIETDEKKLKEVDREIKELTAKVDEEKAAEGREFTNIAKVISQAIEGVASRTYTKKNAKQKYNYYLSNDIHFSQLPNAELEHATQLMSQKIKSEIVFPPVAECLANLDKDLKQSGKILATKVESLVIKRLRDNPKISTWVEQGLSINQEFGNGICEFCGNQISEERLCELHQYFNAADSNLKKQISIVSESLQEVKEDIKNLSSTDSLLYYHEFQDRMNDLNLKLSRDKATLSAYIDSILEQLKLKKEDTSKEYELNQSDIISKFSEDIVAIKDVVDENNKITNNFSDEKNRAKVKIEKHYLATIQSSVESLKKKISDNTEQLNNLKNGNERKHIRSRDEIVKNIDNNKSKISSTKKGCDELNSAISDFLGSDEIAFRDSELGEFLLFREGKPATHLSEGEKTAIGFIFFVEEVKSRLSEDHQGIVVIDDPVSSLDSMHQFQAFSYMAESTNHASQVFVFTHNFAFLKLCLNWVKHDRRGAQSFYMVKNELVSIKNGSEKDEMLRCASLQRLDALLENYETEYQYLFKLVHDYHSDGSIATAYMMPNVCRKLLDVFLLYRVPVKGSPFKRLERIKYSETDKRELYKFVNDSSHITGDGFDASLVPETQRCVDILLGMMKNVDPEHYDMLEEDLHD